MRGLNVKTRLFGLWLLLQGVAFAGVDIQTWQTEKGAKVMYVYAPEIPMVDVEMRFDAGSSRDGQDWGIASLTSSLLGTATPRKNENEIAEGFNQLGVQMGASAGRDSASIQMRSLTRTTILKPALDLLSEVVTEAVFRPDVLARIKAQTQVALKQKSVTPGAISRDALWSALYGDHPYAHPTMGTLETVEAIDVERLKAFYERYYVAKNAQITIVGAVDKMQAEKIAEQLTLKLDSGEKPAALPQPKPVKAAQETVIPFEATQTYYNLAQLGVKRGDPDYYALFLGNHVLGGSGFGSLLVEEVREKRGLTYGVSSYFVPMAVPGPFLIGLSTKNASAKEADQVVKQTLSAFLEDFDTERLEAMKSNLINGFSLRFSNNSKLLGYVSMIGFYDLPLDYLEQFPKIIQGLSKAQVLAAWQRHVTPDKMLTLMVGQPS